MPATAARAAFVREQFRRAVAITSEATTRFGKFARISEDPIETFFDDVDDAQTMATARQALLGEERRAFDILVQGTAEAQALEYIGTAVLARFVDTERGLDQTMLVSEIVIDHENNQSKFRVWG